MSDSNMTLVVPVTTVGRRRLEVVGVDLCAAYYLVIERVCQIDEVEPLVHHVFVHASRFEWEVAQDEPYWREGLPAQRIEDLFGGLGNEGVLHLDEVVGLPLHLPIELPEQLWQQTEH